MGEGIEKRESSSRGGASGRVGGRRSRMACSFVVGALALAAGLRADTAVVPVWDGSALVARQLELPPGDPVEEIARLALFGAGGPHVDAGGLDSVERFGEAAVVRLTLDPDFVRTELDESLLERWSRQLDLAWGEDHGIRRIHLVARESEGDAWRAVPDLLAPIPRVPEKEGTASRRDDVGPVRRSDTGALDGKVVFLSQAHGWIDDASGSGWRTQRGVTHQIIEDFVNAEAIDQMLVDELERAGAFVFTLRERDMRIDEVIVDEADGAAHPANGAYEEIGPPGLFSDSGQDGFANFSAPYASGEDPFRDNGGTARLLTTAATPTARAVWTPVIPETGLYRVSVCYTRDGASRASDARYVVAHSGGETSVRVDQERHGWVWVDLGRFHFEAGFDTDRGSVTLWNDSSEPGETVSLDAVRFGGGVGDVQGHASGTLSGRPRWEEGARTYTQFLGAPESVWGIGDVAARSRFAAWEHFADEDSVYVSWHSNAFDGTVRGTSSYVYSANPPDGSYDPTQSVEGSSELQEAIHDEIVDDVRAAWDPSWTDRGLRSAYFGEVNPAHNDEMPSVLLEVAFHDNEDDAEALSDPRFRRILARAIAQGITRYFAERDGLPVRLLPDPPVAPWARSVGAGTMRVGWSPPAVGPAGLGGDPATSYRVSTSPNGRGFDEGVETTQMQIDVAGFAPGEVVYVRVQALNEGGVSLPSEVLAVRMPVAEDTPSGLLVQGFDRFDRHLLDRSVDPDLGTTLARMDLERLNSFSYVRAPAEALRDGSLRFDAASNEAATDLLSPEIVTGAWDLVVWGVGEESTADETFDEEEQAVLAAAVGSGVRLFATGAEIAWDLDHLGSTEDRIFLEDVLGATYVADSTPATALLDFPGSILEGRGPFAFDAKGPDAYPVEYPDVIAPAGPGSAECLLYEGTSDSGCVVSGDGKVVTLGVPFESIRPAAARARLMRGVVEAGGLPWFAGLFADGFESGDASAWD